MVSVRMGRGKGIVWAAVLALFLVTAPGARRAVGDATPGTPPADEATEAPAGATVSLDDYLAGVAKAGSTDAERKEFAEKHDGKKVTWTGYVRAVSRNKSTDGDTFLVILKSKPAAEPPPGLFLASFDVANEKSLVALTPDQKVTVSGTLSTKQNPAVPLVTRATLEE
jgi:hypothetical protein